MTLQSQDTLDPNQAKNTYLDLFGLQTNPFQEPVSFLTDTDKSILETVVDVLEGADKAVLLAARNESYKDRMLDAVRARLRPKTVYSIRASLMMTEGDLLSCLADNLQLAREGKGQADLELELSGMLVQRPHALTVIEDAQLMSETLVHYLLHFARRAKLKLILLAANADIFSRINDQQLFRWRIDHFSPEATRQYLEQRFRTAGMPLPDVFDEKVMGWICAKCEGEQGCIDQAAVDVMKHTRLERAPLTGIDYLQLILLLSVVLLLFPGAYLVDSYIFSSAADGLESIGTPAFAEAPAKVAPAFPFGSVSRDNDTHKAQAVDDATVQQAPEDVTVAPDQSIPKVQQGVNLSETGTAQLPDTISVDWLKRVNPDFYTIQVFGSHSRDKIDLFMRTRGPTKDYGWFESRYKKQQWFVVIKGIYPDREAALREVEQVKRNTGQTPWVRSFGGILAEM